MSLKNPNASTPSGNGPTPRTTPAFTASASEANVFPAVVVALATTRAPRAAEEGATRETRGAAAASESEAVRIIVAEACARRRERGGR